MSDLRNIIRDEGFRNLNTGVSMFAGFFVFVLLAFCKNMRKVV